MTLDIKYKNGDIVYFMYNDKIHKAPIRGCHLESNLEEDNNQYIDITYHFKANEVDTDTKNTKNKYLYFSAVYPSKEELINSL